MYPARQTEAEKVKEPAKKVVNVKRNNMPYKNKKQQMAYKASGGWKKKPKKKTHNPYGKKTGRKKR